MAAQPDALPPAVFFVLVKPNSTQNPMNSARTNPVLDSRPWSVPMAI